MAPHERDYIANVWEKAHELLLPNTRNVNLVDALCTIMKNLIPDIRPHGGIKKSKLIWMVLGKLWQDNMGDNFLREAEPRPGECITIEETLDVATIQRIADGLYRSADDLVTALLDAAPSKPVSFTPKHESIFPPLPKPKPSGETTKGSVHPIPNPSTFAKRKYAIQEAQAAGTVETTTPKPTGVNTQPKTSTFAHPVDGQKTNDAPHGTTAPILQGAKTQSMTLVDETQPKSPKSAQPIAKYSLKSMGEPPTSPAHCESYEVQLPRDVKASDYVAPYMARIGRMLGVWIQVGSKNSVYIKPHKEANNDRSTVDEISRMDSQYRIRLAYAMFSRWVADMYSKGAAEDLADFIMEEMARMARFANSKSMMACATIDRLAKLPSAVNVKPPTKAPEHSHFFTPTPNSEADKDKDKEHIPVNNTDNLLASLGHENSITPKLKGVANKMEDKEQSRMDNIYKLLAGLKRKEPTSDIRENMQLEKQAKKRRHTEADEAPGTEDGPKGVEATLGDTAGKGGEDSNNSVNT